MELGENIRRQALACASLGSPMYAGLLERVADDVDGGGLFAELLADHVDAPGPAATGLRLAGSIHRLVLERRAGALAAYYPSVGGAWELEGGWLGWCDLVAAEPAAVREWLDRPPQTNEIGRAAGLMGGLLTLTSRLGDLPVRLVEVGSSAGLNLLADQFRYGMGGAVVGPADSPVLLDGALNGSVPVQAPWPRIVERVGSDVMPIDASTTDGRLALTAYVWADQVARHERLRGALALAAHSPVRVERAGAAETVEALGLVDGALTVLWHSVMWQYLDRREQERVRRRIDTLGASASSAEAPFAHLFLEPTRRTSDGEHEFLVVLETWPGGTREVLATTTGHGLPVVWAADPLGLRA